jgi:hypothetical protein
VKQSSIIRVLAIALLVELGTAELAAQTWQPLPDLRHRKASAMAYDPIRKRVVMYGGLFGLGLSAWATTGRQIPLSDTWEWDGNQWHPRFPQQDPGPLAGHKMAWDPVRKEVLLFGGSDNFSIFGETWSWDGSQLDASAAQELSATSIPPRPRNGLQQKPPGHVRRSAGLREYAGRPAGPE